MGLFGEFWPHRGGGMRGAKPSRMVIPPGWFLFFLLMAGLITMAVWL
jgi:hypothetical protein